MNFLLMLGLLASVGHPIERPTTRLEGRLFSVDVPVGWNTIWIDDNRVLVERPARGHDPGGPSLTIGIVPPLPIPLELDIDTELQLFADEASVPAERIGDRVWAVGRGRGGVEVQLLAFDGRGGARFVHLDAVAYIHDEQQARDFVEALAAGIRVDERAAAAWVERKIAEEGF